MFQWAGFNHPDTRCVTSAAVAANVMTNRARLWFVQSSLVRHHGGATWQTLWKRTCPYAAFTCSSDGLIPPPVEKSFLVHWCVHVRQGGMREQHGCHGDVSQFTAQSVLNKTWTAVFSILMSRKDKGNHSVTI